MRSTPPPTARFPDCTGALLAGGQAVRLGGVPKGLLRVGGEPVARRAQRLFERLFAETVIVANQGEAYSALGARTVPDLLPDRGAPGGLHAALAAARTGWVFTAGCDMPFLGEGPIAWLAERRAGARAVAVLWRDQLQPLHAFWSRECFAVVDRLLRQGTPSMWRIATAVGARLVPEAEWRTVDPLGRSFENVNTPADALRLGLTLP
jgi:molybdopterin-guanine dinucleotide biosynthesis protein A